MIMTLARGIAMPRGTNNATCHIHRPDTWHFFFQKIQKKNQKLTRGTLTNDVSQLRLKGT